MRVISGSLKGHTLFAPKGRNVRPTSDLAKETLFNIIGPQILHTIFLDLFAGTGNIGIEALSRGAERVVFVEKNPSHVRVLKRNLATCAVESKSRVYCGDANKILHVIHRENWRFDIIFLDPPYRQTNMLTDMLKQLVSTSLLNDTELVVAEHIHTFISPPTLGGKLCLAKQRRIGDTVLSFYQKEVNL